MQPQGREPGKPGERAWVGQRPRVQVLQRVRAQRRRGGLDAFLHQYALTTEEGVVLMCLAEALLRVPDAETQDKLIKDKIGSAHMVRLMSGRRPRPAAPAPAFTVLTNSARSSSSDRNSWRCAITSSSGIKFFAQ